ncbi:hypothetical protein R69658_07854 [Paraburkholderia aspalathi]|uniref:Uncharacterized protein n=2 Tax=Paraburkholderia aspalathi TaxID=1324617 RepID=A0ABN7NGP9_9BURK|nr:hypothetical protein [Paraburkholderia aspalathi]CAE6865766.1 hypothetical protein R69658_07854 [Paraburkholderia aspalathi]
MSIETNGDVLLDDGEYFVRHNVNYPPTAGNGFLMRRCRYALTTPEGAECVGRYELKLDGKWLVDIAAYPDDDNDADCRVIGRFDGRLDAIHALWQHRHAANDDKLSDWIAVFKLNTLARSRRLKN